MALAEGVVAAGSQDSGYEAAKRRARNIASGQAASQDTSKSVFDVRSLWALHILGAQALFLLYAELCRCV